MMLLVRLRICMHLITNVKHLVVDWARRLLANACTALLYLLVLRLFICSFVKHESRWRHVSFCCRKHKLHSGEMSWFRVCFFRKLLKYRPHWNFRTHVICELVIYDVSQNKLVHLRWISLLFSHFLRQVLCAWWGRRVLMYIYIFSIYPFRLRI